MTERRFLVSAEDFLRGEGAGGNEALIRGAEHHHLSRVLRLKAGDAVSVFDGAGRGYRGVIGSVGKDSTRVALAELDDRAVEPAFHLTLAQGLPHHDKMDLIIQKTTEVGVGEIVPIVSDRSVIRPGRDGEFRRLERWRRVAREAARQSGRLRIPDVASPVSWPEFVNARQGDAGMARLQFGVGEPAGGGSGHLEVGPGARSAIVAVGPEGGWTPQEVSIGLAHGFEQIALGPRILRTETAGIVAVSLVLFLAGELGVSPGHGSDTLPGRASPGRRDLS